MLKGAYGPAAERSDCTRVSNRGIICIMRIAVSALIASLFLVACASQVPQVIREAPESKLSLAAARSASPPIGARVRWGGTIAKVENQQADTLIEIVERPLDGEGRPTDGDRSSGRFIAKVAGFVDPAVYESGREITVVGNLTAPVTRKIGQYVYRFPVVDVIHHYLWPLRPVMYPSRYYDPFWYDPWYPWGPSPWYPWHPYRRW